MKWLNNLLLRIGVLIDYYTPLTEKSIKRWGYCPSKPGYYCNWSATWLFNNKGKWEYGHPNHYMIDDKHPFIKKGDVSTIGQLDRIIRSRTRGMGGLKRK